MKTPSAYGVIKINEDGLITDFVEKPKKFVSDLSIIGIYFFKDGNRLRDELQFLIDNNIKENGEFQLTNALENMKVGGVKLYPGKVLEWLDCGNPEAAIYANKRVLEYTNNDESRVDLRLKNSSIINS